MKEWRLWFDSRLDDAIEAAEVGEQLESAESTKLSARMNNSRMIVISSFSILSLFPLPVSGHRTTLVNFNNFLEGNNQIILEL